MACFVKIDVEVVNPPYIPAMITQIRKKQAIYRLQLKSEINKDQISPADRKPLYRPWFAASFFVFSKRSAGNFGKVFLPTVVQANISIQRI